MSFNPHPSKQGTEMVFYNTCNNIILTPSNSHLAIILDSELNFNNHLSKKYLKLI